CQQNNSLVTF
nr:immunoglobulin light chain junction region [Macaca mulatta]MOW54008.1 immunoglobulin light chain junction region [Macaca mulatta]MOW54735.1 immunoglobulin light chain junction region [Macaca mulatta]MOW54840.1 immunoglobulin light chain junction region [Macaca mulatta]